MCVCVCVCMCSLNSARVYYITIIALMTMLVTFILYVCIACRLNLLTNSGLYKYNDSDI